MLVGSLPAAAWHQYWQQPRSTVLILDRLLFRPGIALPVAARVVISSVGHPLGYPRVLRGGKGLPVGPIEVSPCRPGGSGVGLCLPGRGDDPSLWHLERFAQPGNRGLVFVGPKGAPLRRSNFLRVWHTARSKAGVPGLHFHDLRHLGGTLAAATGATLKELMARLGHSSTRAALMYQHATTDRDQAIANALGSLVREVRNPGSDADGKAAK
jgi:hypothetical protein